jgi:hypothetical protein
MIVAMTCAICGEAYDDLHDITGRDSAGGYLDPELLAPLCHSDHELCGNDDWNTLGIHDASRSTFLDSLELRLARLGSFMGRLAEALPEPLATLIGLIALHLARWRAGLGRSIVALDRYSPGWRAIPGV